MGPKDSTLIKHRYFLTRETQSYAVYSAILHIAGNRFSRGKNSFGRTAGIQMGLPGVYCSPLNRSYMSPEWATSFTNFGSDHIHADKETSISNQL
jgi:hypothetical protein